MGTAVVLALMLFTEASTSRAYQAAFLDEKARAAYARGKNERALALFLEVQALAPAPANLFNLGAVAKSAGEPQLAHAFWTAYLEAQDADRARSALVRRELARLESQLALIAVTSTPTGADIFIDERDHGSYGRAPQTIAVTPGEHAVTAELDGYRAAERRVVAIKGVKARLHVALEPKTGSLTLDVQPPYAASRATDARGRISWLLPGRATELPVGAYTVTATATGHLSESLRLELREGAEELRRLVLRPSPRPTGRLLVSTGGLRAALRVGGRRLGETPAVLDLEAGAHRVEIDWNGRTVWAERVVIEPGSSVVRMLGAGLLGGRGP